MPAFPAAAAVEEEYVTMTPAPEAEGRGGAEPKADRPDTMNRPAAALALLQAVRSMVLVVLVQGEGYKVCFSKQQ